MRMPAHPLDNPCYTSLTGPHAGLAGALGRARSYPLEVCRFQALPDDPTDADWADLAGLVGPDGEAVLFGLDTPAPAGWTRTLAIDAVQLVDERLEARSDPEAVVLGRIDVPEMLDLVARTQPGPFEPDTIAMGVYLGIRREGRLVAMAGERMHPPGHTEISAVCTDPAFRGQGLAARLVRAVAAGVRARGERPFLHTTADNAGAIRLYESMGFVERRRLVVIGYAPPGRQRSDGAVHEVAHQPHGGLGH